MRGLLATALLGMLALPARADVVDAGNLSIGGTGVFGGSVTVQGSAFSVAGGSVTLGGRLNAAPAGIRWADGTTSTTAASGMSGGIVIVTTYSVTSANTSVNQFNGVCYGTATITTSCTARVTLSFGGAGHNATSTDKIKVALLCNGDVCEPYKSFGGDFRGMGFVPGGSDTQIIIPAYDVPTTFSAGTHNFCWTAWRTSGSSSNMLCGATAGDPYCILHVKATCAQ